MAAQLSEEPSSPQAQHSRPFLPGHCHVMDTDASAPRYSPWCGRSEVTHGSRRTRVDNLGARRSSTTPLCGRICSAWSSAIAPPWHGANDLHGAVNWVGYIKISCSTGFIYLSPWRASHRSFRLPTPQTGPRLPAPGPRVLDVSWITAAPKPSKTPYDRRQRGFEKQRDILRIRKTAGIFERKVNPR